MGFLRNLFYEIVIVNRFISTLFITGRRKLGTEEGSIAPLFLIDSLGQFYIPQWHKKTSIFCSLRLKRYVHFL